jgi:hypothetical protein
MMATPCDLEDFAYGFSLTEGRAHPRDIIAIEIRPVLEGIFLDIKTRHPAPIRADEGERNLPGRSGCGICGSRLLEEVVKHPAPVAEGRAISRPATGKARTIWPKGRWSSSKKMSFTGMRLRKLSERIISVRKSPTRNRLSFS